MSNRTYHPIDKWEEIKANMWGDVDDRDSHLKDAIGFTSDAAKYGEFMMRVVREWKYSCENALTDSAINKKAWVGHAACAMALGCPEDIVREAWSHLTYEQRTLANRQADRAIQTWENDQRTGRGVRHGMEEQMLFGGYP